MPLHCPQEGLHEGQQLYLRQQCVAASDHTYKEVWHNNCWSTAPETAVQAPHHPADQVDTVLKFE